MKVLVLLLTLTLAAVVASVSVVDADPTDDEVTENELIENDRDGKFLFFIKILPEPCNTGDPMTPSGTCMDQKGCRKIQGTATSRCAKGLGTCCLIRRTCGGSTNQNNTFFVSQSFPDTNTMGGRCALTVNRIPGQTICQLRIDFISFVIAQPNMNGICSTDIMTVTGGTSSVPTLCGRNTGQHIYVDVDPRGGPVRILVDEDVNNMTPRIFNMRVSQIPCGSRSLAPPGCLQYFPMTSGNVQSFNFPTSPETTAMDLETRQLSNTEYSACVRPESGFCSISWSPNNSTGNFNFFVDTVFTPNQDLIGEPAAATRGDTRCVFDYVLIAGGESAFPNGTNVMSDRYCGVAFPNPVTSSFRPFNLFVKTDGTENDPTDLNIFGIANVDSGNFGFNLNFRQNIC